MTYLKGRELRRASKEAAAVAQSRDEAGYLLHAITRTLEVQVRTDGREHTTAVAVLLRHNGVEVEARVPYHRTHLIWTGGFLGGFSKTRYAAGAAASLLVSSAAAAATFVVATILHPGV